MMTEYQRALVEEHLYVVDWVIKTRLKVPGGPHMSHEDFFQTGCEALCRAAMRYDPATGSFEPYASRVIYNSIIDYCRKTNARAKPLVDMDMICDNDSYALNMTNLSAEGEYQNVEFSDAMEAFQTCRKRYEGIVLRGIEAMELKMLGFETRDIAAKYQTTVNNVNAWISRARKRLQADPELMAFFA